MSQSAPKNTRPLSRGVLSRQSFHLPLRGDRLLFCMLPILAGVALCGLGSAFAVRTSGARPDENTSQYVGSETCQACHDDLYRSYTESAHEKLERSTEAAKRGCEGCHGPGADHVNGAGDASKIFRFQLAKNSVVRERCRTCHEVSGDEAHVRRGVSCLHCHSAHHYTQKKFILVQSAERLCLNCHR